MSVSASRAIGRDVESPGSDRGEVIGSPRLALVHEWLDLPGGAEQVLIEMIRAFPQADVWSLWNRAPAANLIPAHVQTSWLARTPLAGRKAVALPLMPVAWRTLPRRDYDVVITSSYALAHMAQFRGSRAHKLHYVHTPGRYWWAPEIDTRAGSSLATVPRALLRALDRRVARKYSAVAANSNATRERIMRSWGVDARVIFPPVDTEFFHPGAPESSLPFARYVLGVSRWVPYKRLDLVIAAAERAGIPAVIAGSGPMEVQLRRRAERSSVPVRFEVRPSRERLRDLYRGAEALIFPVHEDFGIVPVEAMACGTAVVGLDAGGLRETVEDRVSGRLVASADPASLVRGLSSLPSIDAGEQAARAERFSAARFRAELRAWVADECASGSS